MKAAYIIPGSGEAFYCENCQRDLPLIEEIKKLGDEILTVPLYLPLFSDNPDHAGDTRIFFGAIDMYLSQNVSFYKKLPIFFRKLLDSRSLLRLVARFSGSTSPEGLEQMTLNMLDPQAQANEKDAELLYKLLKYSRVDIIHISNALLLGLGVYLKRKLNLPLVCTLQDEDSWLDAMCSPFREEAWLRVKKLAKETDLFLPVSDYYGKLIQKKISMPDDTFLVIPVGLDIEKYPFYPISSKINKQPTLVYLSHQKEGLGLDILVKNYLKLRSIPRFSRLRLLISGGSTIADRGFVKKIKSSIKKEIRMEDVRFFSSFQFKDRIKLLKEADILSVPMEQGEAFGIYLLEAMACGVPVVQPDTGAFPEIINRTGGGLIYDHKNPDSLYNNIKMLLEDRELRTRLSENGRKGVAEEYSRKTMALQTIKAYQSVLGKREEGC